MNPQQLSLFELAGQLARRFNEAWRRRLKEPGPDRPWFFHPLGYWIDVGFNGQQPEYDQPKSKVDPRTAKFAAQMGALSRTAKIWEEKESMVLLPGGCSNFRISPENIYRPIWITNPDD